MDIKDLINKTELISWRRHLHANPELSGREENTSRFIENLLCGWGIKCIKPAANSVIGHLSSGTSLKTIVLRADMDALAIDEKNELFFKSKNEGVAHMCGHDAHMAILLETARILSGLKEHFNGIIKFVFQHSEENPPGGALDIVNSGKLGSFDAAFALHVMPEFKAGTASIKSTDAVTANADLFFIDVKGKGAHGSMPHLCVDPILVASTIITSLQNIVSRNIPPSEPAVVSVGEIKAGTAPNIIPESAYISGTARTFSSCTRELVKKRLREISLNVGRQFGAETELRYIEGYPSVINDRDFTATVIASAKKQLGEERVVEAQASLAGEDFAYYTQIAPSCLVWLGCGTSDENCGNSLHSPEFYINEEALEYGVCIEVQTVLDFLAH